MKINEAWELANVLLRDYTKAPSSELDFVHFENAQRQ